MIVDIRKFIYDKLYNHEDERMENTNYKALRNIWNFVNIYNLGNKGKLTTISDKINIKKQVGGRAFSIKLKDNKIYTYHLDKITSLNKKNTHHELCFLNLNEDNKCLCFTYHTKDTNIDILKIEDIIINDNDKYIECNDSEYKFKHGDILMQILIELVKTNDAFTHIKYIQLQDNLMKKCYGIGIQLKYLRTITDGIPYYAKFGFKPIQKTDLNIFEFNKRQFIEKSLKINNNLFDDLFLKIKQNNNKLYNFYNSTYRPYILDNKKIEYITFIRKMIDMDKESNFSKSKKESTCKLVADIVKPLFMLLGYKDYDSDMWILKINRYIQK